MRDKNCNKFVISLVILTLIVIRMDVVFGQVSVKPVNTGKYLVNVSAQGPPASNADVNRRKSTLSPLTRSSVPVTPPNISYQTPQVYSINNSIIPLTPTNTGGAVPATIYGQISTYAGSGASGNQNGAALSASFSSVTGVGTDAAGNVYVDDWSNNLIREITPAGNVITFAGSGNAGANNGQGINASFNEPDGLVVDGAGNVYIGDQANNLIRKITPQGLVTTFAGSGAAGNTDGTGTSASFNSPRGLAVDGTGNVYVADQQNNLIRKITPTGVVTTIAGNGTSGFVNGTGTAASFNTPTGVGVDAVGNLYVADAGNNAIRKITPAGVVSTVAGNGAAGFADGTGSAASFNFPREVRADGTGNLYVTDANNNAIRRITPAGVVSTIPIKVTFNYPLGLVLDGNGNLFAALDNQNQIKKMVISGYTIDKPLPAGLSFDGTTGIISGTPTAISPSTDYIITAYNGGGSSSTIVNIQILAANALKPSVITFVLPAVPPIDANNNINPGATSTNNETPITYTSSNTSVAIILPNGLIHLVGPGVTNITASQSGNANYSAAVSVTAVLTVKEFQSINFQPFGESFLCTADFPCGAVSSNAIIPLTYSSSNTAVATISSQGLIHITGVGSTTITVSQAGNALYIAATPQSQVLIVSPDPIISVNITPDYYGACAGMTLTYTAKVTGGSNAVFQWKVNGQNAGTNDSTFTSSTLQTGDKITCFATTALNCTVSSATSNTASLAADPYITNSVTITSTAVNNIIAPNEKVTFTAETAYPDTGITIIGYQWQVNGINAGTNSKLFTANNLADGDQVTCVITTSGKCIAAPTATSNVIKIIVEKQVIVMNTFTPNGDGINDTWDIPSLSGYASCTVNVFTRQGMLIYNSIGYPKAWDGTYNGKSLPIGTYYYVIDLKNGKNKLSGSLTILR